MTEHQMSLLLSAIWLALASNDSKRAIDLTNAGRTMIKGSEVERQAAWREIAKLAGFDEDKS
jgi:hypothetical protein